MPAAQLDIGKITSSHDDDEAAFQHGRASSSEHVENLRRRDDPISLLLLRR
jgi:hypothetical protein